MRWRLLLPVEITMDKASLVAHEAPFHECEAWRANNVCKCEFVGFSMLLMSEGKRFKACVCTSLRFR